MEKIALAALAVAAGGLVGAYAAAVQAARVLEGWGEIEFPGDEL